MASGENRVITISARPRRSLFFRCLRTGPQWNTCFQPYCEITIVYIGCSAHNMGHTVLGLAELPPTWKAKRHAPACQG